MKTKLFQLVLLCVLLTALAIVPSVVAEQQAAEPEQVAVVEIVEQPVANVLQQVQEELQPVLEGMGDGHSADAGESAPAQGPGHVAEVTPEADPQPETPPVPQPEFPPVPQPEFPAPHGTLKSVYSQSGIVPLYESMSEESRVLAGLMDGCTVLVMDVNHGWALVQVNDLMGYVGEAAFERAEESEQEIQRVPPQPTPEEPEIILEPAPVPEPEAERVPPQPTPEEPEIILESAPATEPTQEPAIELEPELYVENEVLQEQVDDEVTIAVERQVYLTLLAPEEARMGDTLTIECHMTGYAEGSRVVWQRATTGSTGAITGDWQDDGAEGMSRTLTLTEETLLTAWRVQVIEPAQQAENR